MKNGQPFLKLKYGTYEADKPRLWRLKEGATRDFVVGLAGPSHSSYVLLSHHLQPPRPWPPPPSPPLQHMKGETVRYLELVQDKQAAKELLDMANKSRATPEEIKQVQKELGTWFTDYLHDNGYCTFGRPPTPARTFRPPTHPRSRIIHSVHDSPHVCTGADDNPSIMKEMVGEGHHYRANIPVGRPTPTPAHWSTKPPQPTPRHRTSPHRS